MGMAYVTSCDINTAPYTNRSPTDTTYWSSYYDYSTSSIDGSSEPLSKRWKWFDIFRTGFLYVFPRSDLVFTIATRHILQMVSVVQLAKEKRRRYLHALRKTR